MHDARSDGDVPVEEESLFVSKLWGIFPVFANTLDLNTFIRLSMASKTIRDRCLKDKMIRIQLEEKELTVKAAADGPIFCLRSFRVLNSNINSYVKQLRELKCNVFLKTIRIQKIMDTNHFSELRRFLKEINVKEIESLILETRCREWTQLVPFIKEHGIKNVKFSRRVPDDVLLALLQLQLNSFSYQDEVECEFILQVHSSIPRLRFDQMSVSNETFMELLERIHSGPLKKLIVRDNIDWDGFTTIPFDYKERLPEVRPLLIQGEGKKWILHFNKAVTICNECYDTEMVEITRCHPRQNPLVLLSEEFVHKALAMEHFTMAFQRHFTSFFERFENVANSEEGTLPMERPIVCKDETDFRYFIVNEGDTIEEFFWEADYAQCSGNYDLKDRFPRYRYNHLPLKRFVFEKRIESKPSNPGYFHVESIEEFRVLFNQYEPLPHDFNEELPTRRPLGFKKTLWVGSWDDLKEEEFRIMLYGDGSLVQFHYKENIVEYGPCLYWNLPAKMLFALGTSADLWKSINTVPLNEPLSIDLDTFMYLFQMIKYTINDDSPDGYRLIFDEAKFNGHDSMEELWLVKKDDTLTKCQWKEGTMTFSEVQNRREYPVPVAKYFLQKNRIC